MHREMGMDMRQSDVCKKEIIEFFFNSSCGCSFNSKKALVQVTFPCDYLSSFRDSCTQVSHEELDTLVMATASQDEPPKENFFFRNGNKICQKIFLPGISKKQVLQHQI